MSESYVQVAPDSTGKKIRNLQVQVLQADGTVASVQLQVLAIVDEEGNQVDFSDGADLQQQLLDELRAVRVGMQLLVDWINPAASQVLTVPVASAAARTLNIQLTPNVEENELIEIARDFRADEDI